MKLFRKMFAEKILRFYEGTEAGISLIRKLPIVSKAVKDTSFGEKSKSRVAVGITAQVIMLIWEFIRKFLYVVIFNFLYNIVIFTFGIMLVKKGVEGVERSWKDIFTPGFVSCFIAFAIYWFDLTVPASVQSVVHYCANACTFLSMLVIGMSVVGMKPAAVFGNRRLLLFTGIRFVLVPVVAALLLQSVLTDYIMRATVVLMLALPAGNMPVMLAEQYGKDAHAISESIILSTLLSVVTITFVFMFV